MGFHDVTVQFPWRHARHIYSCSRKYEIIDPSKPPMRFQQIYLKYDNGVYVLIEIFVCISTTMWVLQVMSKKSPWGHI